MNGLGLSGNVLSTHTRALVLKIFTIDKWVTLSVTAVMVMQRSEWNDFTSEEICCWIQPRLVVRELDSFCSLVVGRAINLRLTSHWSGKNSVEQLSWTRTGRELLERCFVFRGFLSNFSSNFNFFFFFWIKVFYCRFTKVITVSELTLAVFSAKVECFKKEKKKVLKQELTVLL